MPPGEIARRGQIPRVPCPLFLRSRELFEKSRFRNEFRIGKRYRDERHRRYAPEESRVLEEDTAPLEFSPERFGRTAIFFADSWPCFLMPPHRY